MLINFLVNVANAQVSLPTFGQESLPAFISSVYSFSLTIVGIAVFVRILQAGFLWLTSAGNASKAGNAKTMMQNAVIGAILLFASYMILYVINPDLVRNTLDFRLSRGQQSSIQPTPQTPPTGGPGALTGVTPGSKSASYGIPSVHAQEGIYVFTIRVTDANGDYYDQDYTMEVFDNYDANYSSFNKDKQILSGRAHYNSKVARAAADGVQPFIMTKSVPNAVIDRPYFAEILAVGGEAPYSYSMAAGSLPVGISLQTVANMPILTIQNKTAQRIPSYAFNQNDRFFLEVTNAAPNSDLYFKWTRNGSPWYFPGKNPDQFGWTKYGITDSQGRWTNEANFTSADVGVWVEYVLVNGAISRPINFQVVAPEVIINTSTSVQTSGSSYVFTPCVEDHYCEDPDTGERSEILTDEQISTSTSSDRCPGLRQVFTCSYPEQVSRLDCSSLQFEWRGCQEEAGEAGIIGGDSRLADYSQFPDSSSGDPDDTTAKPGEIWVTDTTPRLANGDTTIEKSAFCKYSDQALAINCGMPLSGEYCTGVGGGPGLDIVSSLGTGGPTTGVMSRYCAPLIP